MDKQNLFELYEKLYFHEVEVREKISRRLQIPLALLLSITSVFAHIVKGVSFENHSIENVIFGVFFCVSFILLIISILYFIRAFYGHKYEFIPSAIETENYRQKLIETYKDYDSLAEQQHFDEYLFKYYNECSSVNTKVNDKRSEFLHKCTTFLILSALPLAVAFLIFIFAGIDKNSIDKEYKVKLTNPIYINNFSDDLKEKIDERKTKTPAPSITATEKSSQGRRKNTNSTTSKTTKKIIRRADVKR
jgi:hypothetical protein